MGCTMGIQVPVFSIPTPPKGTRRYHVLLSPRCQTEVYQSQCNSRPTSIIHHHHFLKDSMRLTEILAGAGKGLLTLKPTLPLSATDYKCFQSIQSRSTLYKAEEIMTQLRYMKHLRSMWAEGQRDTNSSCTACDLNADTNTSVSTSQCLLLYFCSCKNCYIKIYYHFILQTDEIS